MVDQRLVVAGYVSLKTIFLKDYKLFINYAIYNSEVSRRFARGVSLSACVPVGGVELVPGYGCSP
jgi:hypothetical protein